MNRGDAAAVTWIFRRDRSRRRRGRDVDIPWRPADARRYIRKHMEKHRYKFQSYNPESIRLYDERFPGIGAKLGFVVTSAKTASTRVEVEGSRRRHVDDVARPRDDPRRLRGRDGPVRVVVAASMLVDGPRRGAILL